MPKTKSKHDSYQDKIKQQEEELKSLMATNPKEDEDDQEEDGDNTLETVENEENEDGSEESKSKDSKKVDWEKRYGDVRRHAQKTESELREKVNSLTKELSSLKSDSSNLVPPKTEEELLQWVNEYPDVASIIETIADRKAKDRFDLTEQRLAEIDEERSSFAREKAESLIRKSHPDFEKLRDDDSFHNWAEEQPKWIKDALYENAEDAASVIRVLDLYKVDIGETPSDKKRKQKEAATDVEVKTKAKIENKDDKPVFSESQIKKNSSAWFEKNVESILEAQREGRFEYDITGDAR